MRRHKTARYSALLKRAAVLVQNDERLIDELISIMYERQLSEEDVARHMGVALVSHHVEKDSVPTKPVLLWSTSKEQLSLATPKTKVASVGASTRISIPPYATSYARKESAV